MPGNFSKPAVTDGYVALLQYIRENFTELAKGLDASTATSLPSGAIRYNSTAKRWEKWNGSAWAELVPKASQSYDMRVAQADDIVIGATTAKALGQLGPLASSGGTINANNYLSSGAWFVSGTDAQINFPIAVGGVMLVWATSSGAYLRQSYTPASSNRIWVRYSTNSGDTWSSWKELTANADWDAASGADGYIANKPALGTAAAADKQTNSTDGTSGRVMTVGAFGLGGMATSVTAAGALDALAYTCTVSVTGANRATVGGPAGANSGTVFTIARSAGYGTQIWFDVNGTTYEMFTRTLNNSVWRSWRKIYDQTDILGTVSQSAGVPTGAIIERGASSTGEYVRFADGTQICLLDFTETDGSVTAAGSVFRSTLPYTWVFPASFASLTNLAISATMQPANVGWAVARAVSTGSAQVIKWVPVTETTARIFRVVAIGRWF